MKLKPIKRISIHRNELRNNSNEQINFSSSMSKASIMDSTYIFNEENERKNIHISYLGFESTLNPEETAWSLYKYPQLGLDTLLIKDTKLSHFPGFQSLFDRKWSELDETNLEIQFPKYSDEFILKFFKHLLKYKNQVIVNFQINSLNNEKISSYQAHYPTFEKQMKILQYAFSKNFLIRANCSPLYDQNIHELIDVIRPFINDSIIITFPDLIRMYSQDKNVFVDPDEIPEFKNLWTKEHCMHLYNRYKDDEKIKWRGLFEKILNSDNIPIVEYEI